MKNKKAVSGIIATVLMIGLVIAVVGVVWVVITNLVSEQLEEAGSCLDVSGKVTFNSRYTCYNSSSNEFKISIEVKDIDLEKIVVFVSGAGKTDSYEITKTGGTLSNWMNYSGGYTIYLPGKNSGLTYLLNTSAEGIGIPDEIGVYPVVRGKQCDVSDSISRVVDCQALLTP